MVAQLRSLRVDASLDASGYTAGARQVTSATAEMSSAYAKLDALQQRLPQGLARLTREYLPGYRESERWTSALHRLNRTMGEGLDDMDRATAILRGMETSFGRVATASELAEMKLTSVYSVAKAMRAQELYTPDVGNIQPGRSARDSAEVLFAADEKEGERLTAVARRLRDELDPLASAQDRLNAELKEYQAAAARGILTADELANAQSLVGSKMAMAATQFARAGNASKLNRHEVSNLSYQLTDISVMLASGQSPFLLIMQQGGQIADMLGPRGLTGGAKALGEGLVRYLTSPMNLALLGFAGLAAGGMYAYSRLKNGGEELEDVLKRQRSLIEELRDGYKSIGRESQNIVLKQNTDVLEFRARITLDADKTRLQNELDSLYKNFTTPKSFDDIERVARLAPFRPALDKFKSSARGPDDLDELDAGFMRVSKSATNMGIDINEAAKSFFDMQPEVRKLANELRILEASIDPASLKVDLLGSLRDGLGDKPKPANLYSFQVDTRSDRVKMMESYRAALSSAAGATNLIAEADAIVAKAQGYWNTELQKTAALIDLETRAIYAKSPAQKAALAADRERVNAINSGIDGEQLAIRIAGASRVAYEQATYAIAEMNRQRIQGANDNISAARLEVTLQGASAYERALATANLQSYLDLQRQGEANGLGFDRTQYALLKAKNEELAHFNELQSKQRLFNEIADERKYLGMSERDGGLEKRLRSFNIRSGDFDLEDARQQFLEIERIQNSFGFGARRGVESLSSGFNDWASTARESIEGVENSFHQLWTNTARTGKFSLDGLKNSALNIASEIAYQFAMNGIFDLFDNKRGGGAGGGFLNTISNILFSANGNAFNSGNVMAFANGGAFSNSVVSRPTAFPLGMMGEAGPEAVMPLTRTSSGKLGVVASGGGSASNVSVNYAPSVIIQGNADRDHISSALMEAERRFEVKIPSMIADHTRRSHM